MSNLFKKNIILINNWNVSNVTTMKKIKIKAFKN